MSVSDSHSEILLLSTVCGMSNLTPTLPAFARAANDAPNWPELLNQFQVGSSSLPSNEQLLSSSQSSTPQHQFANLPVGTRSQTAAVAVDGSFPDVTRMLRESAARRRRVTSSHLNQSEEMTTPVESMSAFMTCDNDSDALLAQALQENEDGALALQMQSASTQPSHIRRMQTRANAAISINPSAATNAVSITSAEPHRRRRRRTTVITPSVSPFTRPRSPQAPFVQSRRQRRMLGLDFRIHPAMHSSTAQLYSLMEVDMSEPEYEYVGGGDVNETMVSSFTDVDQMTYDELLALGDQIGDVKPRHVAATAQQIARLPIRMFRSNTNSSCTPHELPTCRICMCEFEDEEVVTTLPCLHFFHKDCVETWLEQKAQCPICQTQVVQDDAQAEWA